MPESLIPQPPTPCQNVFARSMSCAGNSTCTTFFPMTPPLFGEAIRSALYDEGEANGSRDGAVRPGARRGSLRATRRALPQSPWCHFPARQDLRRTDGRAAAPLLRGVGVARHGRVQV